MPGRNIGTKRRGRVFDHNATVAVRRPAKSRYFAGCAHIAKKRVPIAISSLSDACIIIADAQSARVKLHKRVGVESPIVPKEFLNSRKLI
jgi:hypothetical protein